MHEDYDDYDDEDYDHNDNKYQHYFKFDPEAWDAWGKLLYESLEGIIELSPNVWYIGKNLPKELFPVNSYCPSTGDSVHQCLGTNYQGQEIWKYKYFISDSLKNEYILHLQSHARHFINQPEYYKGMFEILN